MIDRQTVHSLDEVPAYARLDSRSAFVNRYYRVAPLGPFAVVLFVFLSFFPQSRIGVTAVVATLLWSLGFLGYGLILFIQKFVIHCPRCRWRFGLGQVCNSCSLPRRSPSIPI